VATHSSISVAARQQGSLLLFLLLTLMASVPRGHAESMNDVAREELIVVESRSGVELQTRVYRPRRGGPFPLAVVSHGSPQRSSRRPDMALPRFQPISRWLLDRGYMVVLPLRRGYGETGGVWAESYGSCANPDYYRAGLASAEDIQDTIDSFRERADVQSLRVLLIGQSVGGWGSIAAASKNPAGVFAVVNLAGGRGGGQPNVGNCAPEQLVEAAGRYGRTSRVPGLWLFASNDKFFAPELSRRMHAAFVKAGGIARYVALPAFGNDGHQMFNSERARSIWQPRVDEFLQSLKP